jgi:hypothetical protein
MCGQENCTELCLNSTANATASPVPIVCTSEDSVCTFSSPCMAACSGWNVSTSCLPAGNTSVGVNDTGCYWSGAPSPSSYSNASVVEVLLPATLAFSVNRLSPANPVCAACSLLCLLWLCGLCWLLIKSQECRWHSHVP